MLSPRRLSRRAHRLARVIAKGVWALAHRGHPVLAHVIPMRRCNLACAYCNEYDAVSKPVPLEVMVRRLDLLASLGTSMITISGGEPFMHPDLDAMVAHTRRRGMVASVITNGYYISRERIERLNRAGLDYLQISIDNVEPDDVSMKSLRLLEPKLRWLADHAEFGVNINSVLGATVKNPEDALAVARRARALGFTSTIGLVHDRRGQLQPLGETAMRVYQELKTLGSRGNTRINSRFQDRLAEGQPYDWRCRAGGRYLYVDEEGRVSYCSQMRGSPGIPLEQYTRADVRREYRTKKSCAPYCTINCVQRVAVFDNWRSPQTASPWPAGEGRAAGEGVLKPAPALEAAAAGDGEGGWTG